MHILAFFEFSEFLKRPVSILVELELIFCAQLIACNTLQHAQTHCITLHPL